jgi:uncharacterized protein involved in oxidation of intracellular sulfur
MMAPRPHLRWRETAAIGIRRSILQALIILNDEPYGSERTYNGLRLALSLAKRPDVQVTVFLMADAVGAARKGQKTPDGHYNLERMVKRMTLAPHQVLLCGTCVDARGFVEADLVEGTTRSTMEDLTTVTLAADKIAVF